MAYSRDAGVVYSLNGRHDVALCRVTLVFLGVPNDSVESFALKGTTMKPGQAR